MSRASDADLIRRCLEGEASGWAALLSHYADLVYSLAGRAGLDAFERADAVQIVSMRLLKALPGLRHTTDLLPWLVVTTRRVAWRLKEQAERGPPAPPPPPAEEDAHDGPLDSLEALEADQRVREGLATLGARCRELLAALYFDPAEPDYDAVARQMGMPRGSVGPTRQRCLEALKAAILEADGGRGVSREGQAVSLLAVGPRPSPARPEGPR